MSVATYFGRIGVTDCTHHAHSWHVDMGLVLDMNGGSLVKLEKLRVEEPDLSHPSFPTGKVHNMKTSS